MVLKRNVYTRLVRKEQRSSAVKAVSWRATTTRDHPTNTSIQNKDAAHCSAAAGSTTATAKSFVFVPLSNNMPGTTAVASRGSYNVADRYQYSV